MPSLPIPTELLYLGLALIVTLLLYRYFTGRGGIVIRRTDFAGLPESGRLQVRHHAVRWRVEQNDSFVAGWGLANGQLVVMRVRFDGDEPDGPDEPDEPDLGSLEVRIDRRSVASDVGWTEKIRDRTLRADVEAILQALAREARLARSDAARAAAARRVGEPPAKRVGEPPAGDRD